MHNTNPNDNDDTSLDSLDDNLSNDLSLVAEDDQPAFTLPNSPVLSNPPLSPTMVAEEDFDQQEEPLEQKTKPPSAVKEWFRKIREKDLLIPTMSTLSIFLIVISLIVIAITVSIPIKEVTTVPVVDLMMYRSTLLAAHVAMKGYVQLNLFNQYPAQFYIGFSYTFYHLMRDYLLMALKVTTSLMPPTFKHAYLGNTNNYTKVLENAMVKLWDDVLVGPTMIAYPVVFNNHTMTLYKDNVTMKDLARTIYSMDNYTTSLEAYETVFYDYVNVITDYCEHVSNTALNSYIATISIIGFCILVVIPVMMFTFFFIMKKDKHNENMLFQTTSSLVKETMADPISRQRFKTFCKSKGFGVHIEIIEKILSFREHCEVSQDMRLKLMEITAECVKQVNTVYNQRQWNYDGEKVDVHIDDRKVQAIYKISNGAERKIKQQEEAKSALIFEILEDAQPITSAKVYNTLVHNYDCYNNHEEMFKELDILPLGMLDTLESELSEELASTHLDFKAIDHFEDVKVADQQLSATNGK